MLTPRLFETIPRLDENRSMGVELLSPFICRLIQPVSPLPAHA